MELKSKKKKKWVAFLVSLFVILLVTTSSNMGMMAAMKLPLFFTLPTINRTTEGVEGKKISFNDTIPRFAYLISGSEGDLEKLWRCFLAVYHPRNYYILHLDLQSQHTERMELVYRVENHTLLMKIDNVFINKKSNRITYKGPSMVANTLHACAILLKRYPDWDWFINLSASDYPLVTQDDLLYVFSSLNRDYNFIEHTSDLRWKKDQRAKPVIIDPALYSNKKSDIFYLFPQRDLPTAFKLFTGSAWMVLSRTFVEYCIWGWDNLPRTLLMYYANFVSSPEGYFQTVICNSPEFIPTVVNHGLHYISWTNPPGQHPLTLDLNDMANMIESRAAFGRKFEMDSPVLDGIDKLFLHRSKWRFTPGGWCDGEPWCSAVRNSSELQPGPGAKRLRHLVNRLINNGEKPCQ